MVGLALLRHAVRPTGDSPTQRISVISSTAPHTVGPLLFLLLGIAAVLCGFVAPKGRRVLTGVGGGLLLLGSVVALALVTLFPAIDSLLSDLFGGRTASMAVDGLDYASRPLLATGVLLLVFGATRRSPRPRHAPASAYPPGTAASPPHGPAHTPHGPAQR